MMLRSAKNREHFYGIGRWESRAAWDAAQPGIIAMKLMGPLPETVRFFDELDELTLASKARQIGFLNETILYALRAPVYTRFALTFTAARG